MLTDTILYNLNIKTIRKQFTIIKPICGTLYFKL